MEESYWKKRKAERDIATAHLSRILLALGHKFVDVELKISVQDGVYIYLDCENPKLKLNMDKFLDFTTENYSALVNVRRGRNDDRIYLFSDRYMRNNEVITPEVMAKHPLYFETLEMTDKEFELWMKLN